MATDQPTPTRVVFRIYPAGDVIALLLDCTANPGHVLCYQHIGQHGEAVYAAVVEQTDLATETQYMPLLRELQRIGYALTIVARRTDRRPVHTPEYQQYLREFPFNDPRD